MRSRATKGEGHMTVNGITSICRMDDVRLDANGFQAGAPDLISGTVGNDLRNCVRNEMFWKEAT